MIDIPGTALVTAPTLRPYQIDLTDETRRALAQMAAPRRLIVQAETGSGKSVFAANLICSAFAKSKSALFIARGRQLVHQFAKHLRNCNLPVGILMANHGWTDSPIQVASKDTLASRYLRNEWIGLRDFDLVIFDECHDQGREWFELIRRFPLVIGLTATPAKANGDGLGEPWTGMVCCRPPSWLIGNGYLAPTRCFAPYVPDLKGVGKAKNGDWIVNQLGKKMDRPSLIGDVVSNWKKYADGRPTIVYGVTIDHAKHMHDAFIKAGVPCRHIDQETPDDIRDAIFQATTAGHNLVITNVAVMSRGVDLPCLSACVLARPTRSFVLYRQCVGRIKRPFPGKDYAVLIDHAGAVYNHGLPDEDVAWKLGDGKNISQERQRDKDTGKSPSPSTCERCSYTGIYHGPCPACGHEFKRSTRPVAVGNGVLVEVGDSEEHRAAYRREAMVRFWKRCLFVMAAKGRNFLAARGMFHSQFKEYPPRGMPWLPPENEWHLPVAERYPWACKKKESS